MPRRSTTGSSNRACLLEKKLQRRCLPRATRLVHLFARLIAVFTHSSHYHDDCAERRVAAKAIRVLFLFALFWSTGCTSDAAGRAKYSLFVREVMEDVNTIDDKYQGVATL